MQTPLPDAAELQVAYSVEYAPYQAAWKEPGWPLWKILRLWTMRRRLSHLKRYGRGKDLLEVGSGAGDFLVAAHQAGWKVQAVEYSEQMAEAMRCELNLDVRPGELIEGLWKEGSFDVVVFWNVLEHLPDPQEAFALAAKYLRPQGRIIFSIPTREAAERGKLFDQYWALLDLPRHLYFFDKNSLSRLCERAGLDLIEFKTPLLETTWCYVMSSLMYAKHRPSLFSKVMFLLVLVSVVVLIFPYIAIQALRGRGTESLAVAVKREESQVS
jgi:SAM-dependent methyltransferase